MALTTVGGGEGGVQRKIKSTYISLPDLAPSICNCFIVALVIFSMISDSFEFPAIFISLRFESSFSTESTPDSSSSSA